jgi:large subunit ribosomal protein L4
VTTTVSVVSPSGAKSAKSQDVELPDEIFSAPVNVPLMHQVVVAQEAAARQGTHATKTRGLVRGGGKKPYRQKGTGRARQGSVRAPQYAGGGTVHGPQPRSYVQRTPKKMKAAALRGALSDRASNGRVAVVSGFVSGEAPKTSEALDVLRAAIGLLGEKLRAKVLVVTQSDDELSWKSLRNVPGVRLLTAGQLNTYDVLVSDHVVFTQAALADLTGRDTTVPAEKAAPAKKAAAPEKAAPADKAAAPEKAAAADEAAPAEKAAPARKTAKKEDDQ